MYFLWFLVCEQDFSQNCGGQDKKQSNKFWVACIWIKKFLILHLFKILLIYYYSLVLSIVIPTALVTSLISILLVIVILKYETYSLTCHQCRANGAVILPHDF